MSGPFATEPPAGPAEPSGAPRDVVYEASGRGWLTPPEGVATGLLVAVHGYGQPPGAMEAFARAVAPAGFAVLVPEGPSAFYRRPRARHASAHGAGRGWIAGRDRDAQDRRNDALLSALLADARARTGVAPERTWLLGYSQGAGVATHRLATDPRCARGLAGLAGGVPAAFRSRLAALAGRPVLWVAGTRDPAYPPDYVRPLLDAWRAAGADLAAHALDADHDLLGAAEPLVRQWLANVGRPGDGP